MGAALARVMKRHLLVTNDFPPKVGGIQSYLGELWRRLPPADVTVLTTPQRGWEAFDATQPYRIVRTKEQVLLPTSSLRRRIDALAAEVGAELVVLDPALPIGRLGPTLGLPYAVIVHGAEITVPGRMPVADKLLGDVLRGATHVIAAGSYPLAEAERAAGRPLDATVVSPGVDTALFHPLSADERRQARMALGLPVDPPLVMGISRLVPRKGFDVLIRAMRDVPGAHLAIAGAGRDRGRLQRLATGLPVTFLGRVPFEQLPDAYGCADVFAMPCRNRWAGLEQEGFGIVFLEAAVAGVPCVAGDSGGVRDAVADGVTGIVVDDPTDPAAVAAAVRAVLTARDEMASAARARTVAEFDYDLLAARLEAAL